MNPQNEDIQDYLDSLAEISLTTGTDLFSDSEPAEPDNCVTLYNTADAGPQLFLNIEAGDGPEDRYETVGLQVRVRNNNPNAGTKVSNDILGILHNRGNDLVINQTLYTLIQALDNPQVLEYDRKNRAIIVTNYRIQRCPNN